MKFLKSLASNFRKFFVRASIILILALSFFVVWFSSKGSSSYLSFIKNLPKVTLSEPPQLYPYPVKVDKFTPAPAISAKSAVVIDAKTGVSIFEKDPNIRHLPASTTKLMTAIVSLERCSPKTIVKVGPITKEGTQMGLSEGDSVSVETLLNGMLIASGNDAAYALSYACSDSFAHFINSMNLKAKELGMLNTHFENPAGFDNPGQYSTAFDLAKLAKVAVSNPLISKIVATQSAVLLDTTGLKSYYVENVNKLLGQVEGIEGVKTGQTEGSLEILITKTTRGGNTIISVLLSSNDRFGESKNLIEWAFSNWRWESP